MKNSAENVFMGIPAGKGEAALFDGFLAAHDFAAGSRKGFRLDVRKFAGWFVQANKEKFSVKRVTTRDITDFREWLRRDQGKAVATVNRCLVVLRRWLGWLADQGHVPTNPANKVKELKRQCARTERVGPERSENATSRN